mmetsp:Transcript_47586/g.111279  ORF Transcript_47586/g.111279 Transcript_47586/m.111279 type:complete len:443 (+) Transcript_47586:93-1421(+)
MSHDDTDLVWPTAKAQLYLSEAAHVKKLIGPDRIRRNKDALRELRCFQEILGDLHAGQFGRAPERRSAAEAAARQWECLTSMAQQRSLQPEALCEAPSNILSFVQCVGRSSSPGSSKLVSHPDDEHATCASSTRAPSTVVLPQEETQSLATTEVTSLLDDVLWSGSSCDIVAPSFSKKHRNREQLGRLANELSEQMDQEYTALMASIDEIQALMEAEVAGDARLPSVEDLQEFAKKVEEAMGRFPTDEVLEPRGPAPAFPRQSAGLDAVPEAGDREQDPPQEPASWLRELEELEALLPGHPVGAFSDFQDEAQHSAAELSARPGAQLPAQLREELPAQAPGEDVNFTSSWLVEPKDQRRRWADLLSDSEEELQNLPRLPTEERGAKSEPAVAQCGRCCRYLDKSFFSRRAWRQVRGKGSQGHRRPDSALCRDCGARGSNHAS